VFKLLAPAPLGPKVGIDPHVLSEGSDATRMAESSVRRPTSQAAPQQVFLDAIQRAPEIVRLLLDPTAAQKACRWPGARFGAASARE
jgi:hypothetical protein